MKERERESCRSLEIELRRALFEVAHTQTHRDKAEMHSGGTNQRGGAGRAVLRRTDPMARPSAMKRGERRERERGERQARIFEGKWTDRLAALSWWAPLQNCRQAPRLHAWGCRHRRHRYWQHPAQDLQRSPQRQVLGRGGSPALTQRARAVCPVCEDSRGPPLHRLRRRQPDQTPRGLREEKRK